MKSREETIAEFKEWFNEHEEDIKKHVMTPKEVQEWLNDPDEQAEFEYWGKVYEQEQRVTVLQAAQTIRKYCFEHRKQPDHGNCVFWRLNANGEGECFACNLFGSDADRRNWVVELDKISPEDILEEE